MPKSSKKKRQAKVADFQKVKLKLGKKKPMTNNYTDTSFTSKSIHLPTQNIKEVTDDDILRNKQNLTLDEVLTRIKHYNAGVRKEGVHGLIDIIKRHPIVLKRELEKIIQGTAKLIIDTEYEVRKANGEFVAALYESTLNTDIQVFVKIHMAYVLLGMSHISEDIREESLKIMNVMIKYQPDAMASFSEKILPNFYTLLSTQSKSANPNSDKKMAVNTNITSISTKAEILNSFYKYLRLILKDDNRKNHKQNIFQENRTYTWMYTQKDSYNVEANQTDYSELNLFGEKMNNQELLSSSKSLMKSSEDMNKEVASSILTNIFPSLQAIWIETASLSFGISGDEAHRNAAVNVIEIMELLLRFSRADFITQIYQYLSSPGPVSKPVATLGSYQIFLLLRSFFLYFPFSKTGSQPNSLVRADISLISITSTLATQLTSFAPINSDVFTDLMSEIRSWFDLVSFHVSESFDSLIKSYSNSLSGDTLQLSSSNLLTRLLTSINSILFFSPSSSTRKINTKLLNAITTSCMKLPSSLFIKSDLIFFINSVVTKWISISFKPPFLACSTDTVVKSWILSLPKLLWQYKTSDLALTEDILSVLSQCCKYSKLLFVTDSDLGLFQKSLVPFFHVYLPRDNNRSIFGPYINLPTSLQLKSTDMLSYLNPLDNNLSKAVELCTR